MQAAQPASMPPKLHAKLKEASKMHRDRDVVLPSIDSSVNSSLLNNSEDLFNTQKTSSIPERLDLAEYIQSIESIKRSEWEKKKIQKTKRHGDYVHKYKKMIKRVEAGNKALETLIEQVHHQTNTFSSALVIGNESTKETRKIGKLSILQNQPTRSKEEKVTEHRYDRLYERLSEVNHQREDLRSLKKAIVANNLNKNFEAYF